MIRSGQRLSSARRARGFSLLEVMLAFVLLAVSLGISSLAVWLLGPLVKGMGFDTLLLVLAGVALCTAFTVLWLPSETPQPATAPA